MKFIKTPLKGSYLIDLEKLEDDRGFFSRAYCSDEFEKQGLVNNFIQCNDSLSRSKGTLRGLHYQLSPHAEVKLVRCIRGALFDVILDIRPESPTFGQWYGAELTEDNRKMMYVPEGFAHGFMTLKDNSEAFYFVTSPYSKPNERGIRWNDPKFAIDWPITPSVISDRDSSHPDFDPKHHLNTGKL